MDDMSPEVTSGIVQALATVGGMGAMLSWLWHIGPGAKISSIDRRVSESMGRMERIVEAIQKDHHNNRDRIQRLEILAEQAQAEKEGRARRI